MCTGTWSRTWSCAVRWSICLPAVALCNMQTNCVVRQMSDLLPPAAGHNVGTVRLYESVWRSMHVCIVTRRSLGGTGCAHILRFDTSEYSRIHTQCCTLRPLLSLHSSYAELQAALLVARPLASYNQGCCVLAQCKLGSDCEPLRGSAKSLAAEQANLTNAEYRSGIINAVPMHLQYD